MKEINIGAKAEHKMTVTADVTAEKVGSGLLPVFATPSMIALVELTACELLAPYLADGITSVGTMVNIKHLSATPVGMEVRCECELKETDGRRFLFYARVYDEAGMIGEGEHERYTVKSERFMEKALAKLDAAERKTGDNLSS